MLSFSFRNLFCRTVTGGRERQRDTEGKREKKVLRGLRVETVCLGFFYGVVLGGQTDGGKGNIGKKRGKK